MGGGFLVSLVNYTFHAQYGPSRGRLMANVFDIK